MHGLTALKFQGQISWPRAPNLALEIDFALTYSCLAKALGGPYQLGRGKYSDTISAPSPFPMRITGKGMERSVGLQAELRFF